MAVEAARGCRGNDDETASKLTFIPERLVQNLIAEGLVLRDILGRGILAHLAKVVLRVAPQGVKVCRPHGFLNGCDVDG